MIEITETLLIIIFTFVSSFAGSYFILFKDEDEESMEGVMKGFFFAIGVIVLILFTLINSR